MAAPAITDATVADAFVPDANVGLLLGAASGGLVDVDLDCDEARAIARFYLPPTDMRHGRAPTGETHRWYLVDAPPEKVSRYKDPAGDDDEKSCLVELRSGSEKSAAQTVIPPSLHPSGARLTWTAAGEPARVEIAALQRRVATVAAAALLARRFPSIGKRNDFALALAGFLVDGDVPEDDARDFIYQVAAAGGSENPDARAAAATATAKRVAAGESYTSARTLAELIGDDGAKVLRVVKRWLGLGSTAGASGPRQDAKGARVTGRRLTCSYLSVVTVIREDRAGILGGRLAFDEMRRAPALGGRELRDVDVSRIRADVERTTPIRFDDDGEPFEWLEASAADVYAALVQVASERPYHPVREYLEALAWDGEPRLSRVAAEIMRADDTPINRAILRRWFISAVARPMKPGCKVDTVVVLVGDQGALKSTFFRVLAGEWFVDTPLDIREAKRVYDLMQRGWIVEWGELESLRRARDAEQVKTFLAAGTDTYTPMYGHLPVTVQRTSIIVGTTNRPEFLADETGERRWWPIAVGEIDIAKLRDWRDQLWAEAVAAYLGGEQWWLTPDEERALTPARQKHSTTDAWDEIVLAFAANPLRQTLDGMAVKNEPVPLTMENVLRYALDMPVRQWGKADEMRVGAILTRAGYRKTGERDGARGRGSRVWSRGAAT